MVAQSRLSYHWITKAMIPPNDHNFLKQAGCFDVYAPGTKIPKAAMGIITRLMER